MGDERTDGRTYGNSPLCSTGLRPLWVRCPASLYITFKNDEQGTGTADHMISLDYLFRVGQDQGLRGQDWDLRGQDWDLRGQDWDLQDKDLALRGQDLGLLSWPQRTNGRMDGRTEI